MSEESEIISFFSFSNRILLLTVYHIFGIFEGDFKIRKMKKMINFPNHFLFFYFCLYFKICEYDKDK